MTGVPTPADHVSATPLPSMGTPVDMFGGGAPSGRATAAMWLGAIALGADFSFLVTSIMGPVAGLILGLIAWVMGQAELTAIRSGNAPAAGLNHARLGRNLGMIAFVLAALGFILIAVAVVLFLQAWTN